MKQPLKILMLEDSETDAEIIRRLLKKKADIPFDFRLSMTKEAYLRDLEEFKPDLILSDNSLPQFNASDALKVVHQRSLHIPFILVTGTVSEEFAAGIIKQGADDYILKDRLARLPAAIDTALRQRKSEKEKLEAAERLRRSEEQYRTILNRVSDAFVALDTSWCYTYVNEQAGKILNRIPAELIGKNIWTEFPEGIEHLFHKAYHGAMNAQQYIHLEEYYPPFNVWLENHIYPSPDGLSIFFRDISERKKAQQKIIQSEMNLRTIFENTSEGFLLMDSDGIVKAVNSKAGEYAFFSKEKDIQVGESIYNFVEEERQAAFKIIMEKVLNGDTVQYDRSYEIKDGNTRWLDFSVTPVSQEGEIKGICITGRDITARKKAEKELNKNFIEKHALAKRMSIILNTLPANIALLDTEGTIVEVNDAWRNFADDNGFIGSNYGIGDNYLAVSKISSGDDKTDGKAVARGIKAVIENNLNEFVFEYACHSPKIKRWFRMVVTPLLDKEHAGAVVMHVDISELRRLEQERLIIKMDEQKKITQAMLQAQEKERNQLGRELHDNISQLLAAIKMKLEYSLGNDGKGTETIRECVDHVKEAMTETRNLSHRMVIPRFEDSGFENSLRYMVKNYNNQQRTVSLKAIKLDEKKIPAAIKESLYRIVQEQLNNIEKYAGASEVKVDFDAQADHITLIIEDNGVGFNVKQKREGIGLTNIMNRAESYNGSAKIISEPGKGCKLIVEVPLREKKETSASL
ncbi:MAG: PAS domain S-box protein [Chitinophagaceae bacterium]